MKIHILRALGGGHVSAELPDCLGTSVSYELVHKDDLPINHRQEKWFSDTSIVRAFACEKTPAQRIHLGKDLTELPMEQWPPESDWYVLMKFVKPVTNGWLAGFANVDLLRGEVTEQFSLLIQWNAYVLNGKAKRREWGILQAIGMSQSQLKRDLQKKSLRGSAFPDFLSFTAK